MRTWSSVRAAALLASLAALFGGPATASAQGSGTVQGTVTDSVGRRPIPGVQVVVAGSTRGALTDDAGRYTIRGVPAGEASIRANRLGFAPAERRVSVAAGGTATADFALRAVATVLSEVVVTGYGTTSRAEISSAVSQVSAEAIQNTPVAGVDAALQGKTPGVQVVQNAGNPGNGITVRVRGSSSVAASNQPLYVIDGIPMIREDHSQLGLGGQDLTAVTGISPDEIESIDVLKDAAAAAIYGSRASNGVIMLTTKRGRPGRARYTLNTYYGRQTVAKKLDMLSASEYVEFMNEARVNDGLAPRYTPGVTDGVNTDWQEEVLRPAPVSDFALGVSGGTERTQYHLTAANFNQRGIVYSTGYDRQNVRLNADFNPALRFSVRSSLGLVRENIARIEGDNTIQGPLANAIAVQPFIPVRQADGEFSDAGDPAPGCVAGCGLEYANPVALAFLNEVDTRTMRAIGGLEGMFDVTDRIRLNARLSADVYDLRERRWESGRIPGTRAAGSGGISRLGTSLATRYVTEAFATYDPIRSPSQRLTLTAGSSLELNETEKSFIRGEGFATDQLQWPRSAAQVTAYDGFATANNLLSYFARANFSFLDRYLATASFRADGSSRFGQNKRFGYFPAMSLGWVATNEAFLSGLKRFADLKLRASVGTTGNQDVQDDFAFLGRFGEAKYAGEAGIAPENFPNPDLRWESTTEYDIGMDMSFLDGRVALIADVYEKRTSNLLVQRPVTSTSGFTTAWDNVGNMTNRGVEFQVNMINIPSRTPGGFDWRTDFNISANRNKITRLFRDQPFNAGIDDMNRVQVGHPIGAYHTLKFLNVDRETGDAVFEDICCQVGPNGERLMQPDGDINSDDRQIVGSPHPDYWGGLRNQLTWKGFDVNVFVEFSQGFEIYNGIRAFADEGGTYNDNKFRHVMRRWRQPGDETDVPRASRFGESDAWTISSRYIEDGSYVRLQEVTFGFRLPSRIAARAQMADARIYVSGRNLKLWTDFMGYDPDVNSGGSGSNTFLGTDFYAYPRARTISFGVSGNW
jgi:TonB-linked SusC/RagA family outer membrane protein